MYKVTFNNTDKNQRFSGSHVTVPDVQLVYPAYRQSLLTQLCL